MIVHGSIRRVGPSNEVMSERRYGKTDGVDGGKEGVNAAAATAALCAVKLVRNEKYYVYISST